tara:strand:- start:72 stop:545 length:474 start_codon:yes stop_codon:yes gene_type:complete
MIEQIYNYFTIEMLYFWVNLGILPFWIILIFFPQSHICRYFVSSIFPIFILSGTYIFVIYKSFLGSYNFIENFNLYLGINNLLNLFTNKSFLMFFWIHFVSINLFVGGWIVKESIKFSMNKVLIAFPLILTYLIGPLGIFLFWLIKIFHSKSITLYD